MEQIIAIGPEMIYTRNVVVNISYVFIVERIVIVNHPAIPKSKEVINARK